MPPRVMDGAQAHAPQLAADHTPMARWPLEPVTLTGLPSRRNPPLRSRGPASGEIIRPDLSVYTYGMSKDLDTNEVAAALRVSIGLLVRRVRQAKSDGDLTLPESSALARLDRGGPTSSGALAKVEQISPQSMGTTLTGLERRGLIERRPDPADGRRIVMSLTEAGQQVLRSRRDAGTEHMAKALSTEFSAVELEQLMIGAQLIERLAQNL